MVKFNNKGFFLVETIVITSVVAAFLVLFYSQISNLYHNYERNAKFNSVDAIHAAYGIKSYLEKENSLGLVSYLNASGQPMYDFTKYSFDNTGYFSSLINYNNIEKVYITQYNINNVITNYASYDINAEFLDFIKTQKVSDSRFNTYRIIVILKTQNYGSVLITP